MNTKSCATLGTEIYEFWQEYEKASSPEAKYVKDFDKFEMILQAYEYETGITCFIVCFLCLFSILLFSAHSSTSAQNMKLQQFYDSTNGAFQTAQVKAWVAELKKRRENIT